MEDDDLDLLLALQPDDELEGPDDDKRTAQKERPLKKRGVQQDSAGAKRAKPTIAARAGSPPDRPSRPGRAYHSPEADKAPARSKVSLSAAFGRPAEGLLEKKDGPPTQHKTESHKDKVRRILDKADHIETHSGLRIKNRVLPSNVVKDKLADGRFLHLSKISSAAQGGVLGFQWATIGVLSEKTSPRESASGRKYGVWKLTDLKGFTCSLFLFGDAFEAHWKETEGSVIGLLNAKYKQESGSQSSAPFSLSGDNGRQVFKLGTSMDLGLCQGTRKDGMPCTMAINKSEGEYCQYHAAGAYQKLHKLQKAQEKGHRFDLGRGKLSKEPHGRVLSNVYVSKGPVGLPPVKMTGKVNFMKPGHLQEMAEQEQLKRAHSQGSRLAMAVAAEIKQRQEKKEDKESQRVPKKRPTSVQLKKANGSTAGVLKERAPPGLSPRDASAPKPSTGADKQSKQASESKRTRENEPDRSRGNNNGNEDKQENKDRNEDSKESESKGSEGLSSSDSGSSMDGESDSESEFELVIESRETETAGAQLQKERERLSETACESRKQSKPRLGTATEGSVEKETGEGTAKSGEQLTEDKVQAKGDVEEKVPRGKTKGDAERVCKKTASELKEGSRERGSEKGTNDNTRKEGSVGKKVREETNDDRRKEVRKDTINHTRKEGSVENEQRKEKRQRVEVLEEAGKRRKVEARAAREKKDADPATNRGEKTNSERRAESSRGPVGRNEAKAGHDKLAKDDEDGKLENAKDEASIRHEEGRKAPKRPEVRTDSPSLQRKDKQETVQGAKRSKDGKENKRPHPLKSESDAGLSAKQVKRSEEKKVMKVAGKEQAQTRNERLEWSEAKRRAFEGCSQLSDRERQELIELLKQSNEEGRSINAGQRIKKVSAESDAKRSADAFGERHVPDEGHVAASKGGFAAAFRDVARVEEGPRESVFKDAGDAEVIERALGSFDVLEKKEELADKMDKIHSITVKGWRCDKCRRSTEKKPELCVLEKHSVRFLTNIVKRFFECSECKQRLDTVGREYPEDKCSKCGSIHFKPTGMRYAVPTKETPYAARENFLARGKEHAFSLRAE